MGVSIGEGTQSSSWEDCHKMCDSMSNCSAWTFHEKFPFLCAFFSELHSIDPKNFTVTGRMNCTDSSTVIQNTEITGKHVKHVLKGNCMIKDMKIRGILLGNKKRQEFNSNLAIFTVNLHNHLFQFTTRFIY